MTPSNFVTELRELIYKYTQSLPATTKLSPGAVARVFDDCVIEVLSNGVEEDESPTTKLKTALRGEHLDDYRD